MTTTAIRPVPEACEEPDQRVRVLVADHDGLARRMMQTALQQADGVVTVPAARDAHEALQHARYYRPTVLLLDSALAPSGCVEVIREVLQAAPQTRILTVSAEEDGTALAALRAGAVGHISKDINPDVLVHLVALAAAGEAIVPRELTTPLLGLLHEAPDTWRPVRSCLTPREWEIVELLGEENSTERIADRLVVSPTTVYSHVKSVLRKLGVHSRQDAVIAAERLRHEEAIGEKSPPPVAMKFL
jgi:DNA-binding NarL/FixJ family response regulator